MRVCVYASSNDEEADILGNQSNPTHHIDHFSSTQQPDGRQQDLLLRVELHRPRHRRREWQHRHKRSQHRSARGTCGARRVSPLSRQLLAQLLPLHVQHGPVPREHRRHAKEPLAYAATHQVVSARPSNPTNFQLANLFVSAYTFIFFCFV